MRKILIILIIVFFIPSSALAIDNPMNLESDKVNYSEFIATAYTPEEGGINADYNPEITSIGEDAEEGIIAVNPDVIPYGSNMLVIGEDFVFRGIAADTGGFAERNPFQIDILMGCVDEAFEFGRQAVHVIWWEED